MYTHIHYSMYVEVMHSFVICVTICIVTPPLIHVDGINTFYSYVTKNEFLSAPHLVLKIIHRRGTKTNMYLTTGYSSFFYWNALHSFVTTVTYVRTLHKSIYAFRMSSITIDTKYQFNIITSPHRNNR